jgi:hypothetical protein
MSPSRPAPVRFSICVSAFVLLAPVAAADAPVTVAVRPSIVFVGGDVRTTVRAPRDPRNRELRVVVEAPEYYASSDVQLDGADAAATHQFTWKALPGGAYRVEAIVTRDGGETTSSTSCFAVLTGDESIGDGSASRRQPPAAGTAIRGC